MHKEENTMITKKTLPEAVSSEITGNLQQSKELIIAQKKEKLIKARNMLGEVFHESKEEWCDNWWTSDLAHTLGYLDGVISKIGTTRPKGVAYVQ